MNPRKAFDQGELNPSLNGWSRLPMGSGLAFFSSGGDRVITVTPESLWFKVSLYVDVDDVGNPSDSGRVEDFVMATDLDDLEEELSKLTAK